VLDGRTTTSCRFIAPSITALLVVAAASNVASQAAAAPDRAAQLPTSVPQWFMAISAAPVAPPVASKDRVFVALRTGSIFAHNLANGTIVWSAALAAEQPLALDDAHVFVVSGDEVHALDGASGNSSWRAPVGKVTAPPLVHAGWLIVSAGNTLSAFRAADGGLVWRRELGATERRPFIDGDWLFTSMSDGRILKLNLHDGTPQLELRLPSPTGEPLVVGDRLYVGAGDKHFYCLDTDGQGEVAWRFRFGSEVRGRPAADAKRVYFTALDNEVRALDLRHGALRWHRGVPFRPSAGPFVLGDVVAVAGPVPELHLFAAADGTRLKSLVLKEPIVSAPALLGDALAQLRIAAVTGGLNVQWKLAVFGPTGETPAPIPVLPLTELPGAVLPVPK
jgi:outer membrane protein assembly factor BamB